MRFALLLLAAAPLFGQQCSYTISPSGPQNLPITGGSGTISVNTGPGCPWTANALSSWLHIDPQTQKGTGPGAVNWTADANTTPVIRTGSIVAAGQTVAFTEPAASCAFTISPTSAAVPVTGTPAATPGTFNVQTTCSWTASSNRPWVTLQAPTSGTGNGTVTYAVASNGCVASQSATIAVGATGIAQAFQITQAGSPSNLTVSPASASAGPAVSAGAVTVTTGSGCGWTAFAQTSWLHIVSGTPGTGSGPLTYRVDANPSTSARVGTIQIGPQVFTVTQQGVPAAAVQLSAIDNAASYAGSAVSPGEIVALFGTNIGPVAAAYPQIAPDGKSLTKSLGGVQVLFDGTPSAVIFASARQVNAVAPYGLSAGSTTQVQINLQGTASNTMAMPVQATTPALFTLDATGGGGGAILNQDYTINGRTNQAARGSIVMIYCTGGGATNPASADAAITQAPPPLLVQPATVNIGGIDAQVVYSGAAPGSVAGLVQINAVVPPGVASGPSVPVVVKIGGQQSQAGVTLAVK